MPAPHREPDPAGDKRRALKLATFAARRYNDGEAKLYGTLMFASEKGASLREIAEATGLSHTKVKRILDRQRV